MGPNLVHSVSLMSQEYGKSCLLAELFLVDSESSMKRTYVLIGSDRFCILDLFELQFSCRFDVPIIYLAKIITLKVY